MKTGLAGKDQTGPVKCPQRIMFCLLPLQLSKKKKQIGIKIDENLVCSQEQQSDHVHAS